VEGGEEKRLTKRRDSMTGRIFAGRAIHLLQFERTGHMQIWRMKADGSEQTQVFSDDYNNWFPHISPDGKWMVFLSFR